MGDQVNMIKTCINQTDVKREDRNPSN